MSGRQELLNNKRQRLLDLPRPAAGNLALQAEHMIVGRQRHHFRRLSGKVGSALFPVLAVRQRLQTFVIGPALPAAAVAVREQPLTVQAEAVAKPFGRGQQADE